MKTLKKVASIGLMTIAVTQAQAGNLIYQPINPSFGGDPFVGSYLLGKAQAQDDDGPEHTQCTVSIINGTSTTKLGEPVDLPIDF